MKSIEMHVKKFYFVFLNQCFDHVKRKLIKFLEQFSNTLTLKRVKIDWAIVSNNRQEKREGR